MFPATLETENRETSLIDELHTMIEKGKPMEGETDVEFEARRETQKVVLDLLPKDIVDNLKSHLAYEKSISRGPLDENAVLSGEVFEQLTSIQHEIELRMKGTKLVSSKPIQQLKSVLKRPGKKLFSKIGIFRKPDIIDIQEDSTRDGSYIVSDLFEVKARTLGPSDIGQLKGFADGFDKFCEAVKQLSPFEAIEFTELQTAIKRGNIRLSENLSQTIYVPANLDKDNLINKRVFDKDKAKEEQLEKLLTKFDVKKSVFSQDDLSWITRVFKDELF